MMDSQNMVGINTYPKRTMEAAQPAYAYPKDSNRHDAPDHHTVSSLVNLLTNDMAQLIEEIGELRARLTPVMADRNSEKLPTPGVPVSCKMAAELGDVYQRLSEARRLVGMTLSELDL